nr:MAG TPA: hypothetical protein [Caudoviricetes sp.]
MAKNMGKASAMSSSLSGLPLAFIADLSLPPSSFSDFISRALHTKSIFVRPKKKLSKCGFRRLVRVGDLAVFAGTFSGTFAGT